MLPIIVCALEGSSSYKVLRESVKAYSPDTPLIFNFNNYSSFGQAMNNALYDAFRSYDEVIISNDDVVITPSTIPKLQEDVNMLKLHCKDPLGFVATTSDNIRRSQTIRCPFTSDDYVCQGKWISEGRVKMVPVLAPVFSYMSKRAFEAAAFPHTSWFSDDIICEDLSIRGFKHFISRAYVHHVGSNSIGTDYDKLSQDALDWVKEYRPEYYQMLLDRSK